MSDSESNIHPTHPEVDRFIDQAPKWKVEIQRLRQLALQSGLKEEWKWKQPCYSYQGANVLIIGGLKDSCIISFFKGALLKDEANLLSKPGENTQSGRVIRFTSDGEISELEPLLRAYIGEAIEVEKSGQKVSFTAASDLDVPDELQQQLDADPAFESAFNHLTPGRQKAYILHFAAPKQAKTRESRVSQCKPRILAGFGLHDCTCGLSKRMPGCDGSHRDRG